MRNAICVCALTLCFCYRGSSASGTEDNNGTLHGVVMDFTGAVVPRAVIRVQHWVRENGHFPTLKKEDWSARTDQNGSYTVTLKPGIYDVFVSFSPFSIFSPVAKKVKIEAGKPAEFSPKLEVDPLEKYVEVQTLRSLPKRHSAH